MKQDYNIPFNSFGEVKLAVRQGKSERPKNTEQQIEMINICLNCKKKVCHGCDRDMRFKKQRTLTDKELLP